MNKNLLSTHIHKYKQNQTKDRDRALNDIQERKDRIAYFQSYTKQKILSITEEDLCEYLSKLWAMLIWGNKQYKVDKIIDENGLPDLRKNFAYLLYGDDKIETRWDNFRKRIKGVGPAMMSELLCHTHPDEFMIWNRKAQTAFTYLEINGIPKYDYQLTGMQYKRLCIFAKDIQKEMIKAGIEDATLLTVDYFLWDELQLEVGKEEKKEKVKPLKEDVQENEFIHNDIRDKLAEIGTFLGFETRIEQKVADGSKVDTIWEMKVGNMGRILYVFEVQTKGSIDSLILNLLKAINNPAVQGVVAVSDKTQLEKIQKHSSDVASLGSKIKFWDYEEVLKVYDSLAYVNETINKLGLVPESF